MKAETMKERPDYELFKQNDVVSFYHMQLPNWLVEDARYMSLSVEAKFIYTLLLSRFRLSKRNGWMNENGEVFVIFTRKELSLKANVGEKRVSAAMDELKEYRLIWERRCGRGLANQIYLASVKISIEDVVSSKGEPLAAVRSMVDNEAEARSSITELRPVETAVLNEEPSKNKNESALFSSNDGGIRENGCFFVDNSEKEAFETQEQDFKNSRNGGSKSSSLAVQEPSNRLPNYIDFRLRDSIYNQSQSKSSQYGSHARKLGHDRQTDADTVEILINQAELEYLKESDAAVMRDAIERLFFMQSIRIGNAIYPNERIRSNLWRMDISIVEDALHRIAKNSSQIRNSSAYVVTVLFNTIMESGSDLIVDPYLNSLRSRCEAVPKSIGGG